MRMLEFDKMVLHRILQTSFFEWCILWLITFASGVSVFIITSSTDNSPIFLKHPKLPRLILASEEHHQHHNNAQREHKAPHCDQYGLATANNLPFSEALARLTSEDKIIILSYVDMGFLDMVHNFIETSISKHNISNMLFFSSSPKACQFLESELCRACHISQTNGASEQQSAFGSEDFISKMNIRTTVIRDALQEGYRVIHTDNDVVFLQNPVDNLKELCDGDCDLAPLWDSRSHNAGFLFIRPSENSLQLYNRMITMSQAFPKVDDQKILNAVIGEMSAQPEMPDEDEPEPGHQNEMEEYVDPDKLENLDVLLSQDVAADYGPEKKSLHVVSLPTDAYLSGHEYFVQGHRNFAGDRRPCKKCLVVHNNWLVKKSSKIWRFKENHMWMVDTNKYYSNPDAKFVTVENRARMTNQEATVGMEDVEEGEDFEDMQRALLENGFRLAKCLNRTLILPKMFINQFSPPLPAWLVHEQFLSELIMKYNIEVRESTFFSHPKVPHKFYSSESPKIKISMADLTAVELRLVKAHKLLQYKPRNQVLGPTTLELTDWFKAFDSIPVLRFESVQIELTLLKCA